MITSLGIGSLMINLMNMTSFYSYVTKLNLMKYGYVDYLLDPLNDQSRIKYLFTSEYIYERNHNNQVI